MPSRKRIKGKDRKARQLEASMSNPQKSLKEWLAWGERNEKINCNHGVVTDAPRCEQFLEYFFNGMANGVELLDNMSNLLTTFPDVFTEGESHRNVVNVMSRLAANLVLYAFEYGNNKSLCLLLRPAIVGGKVDLQFKPDSLSALCLNVTTTLCVLVHYDGGKDIESTFYHPHVAGKIISFNPQTNGSRRVLKFLSMLNTCSCLKELYAHTKKTHEKLSYCSHCKSIKKRSSLMVCGDCRIENYCSKECQSSAWNDHQIECGHIIDLQKR